jgi:hypothetical protein
MKISLSCVVVFGFLLGCAGTSLRAEAPVVPVVNREYLPAVLDLINGATNSLEFIQLECHDDRAMQAVEAALAAAVRRGVRVRGILDDGVDFNAAAVERLRALGAEAKLDTPVKMNPQQAGDRGWPRRPAGLHQLDRQFHGQQQRDNVRLDDPVLAATFGRYFAALWADSARSRTCRSSNPAP